MSFNIGLFAICFVGDVAYYRNVELAFALVMVLLLLFDSNKKN